MTEIPFAVIRTEIELGQCRGAVTHRHQSKRLGMSWNLLGHNTETAVSELVNSPQLFIGTCKC